MTDSADATRRIHLNPDARQWRCEPLTGIADFHAALPGYAPTPLVELPALASELGVARVLVKDESSRMGLPAFKLLGVAYSVIRALSERLRGDGDDELLSIDELRDRLAGSDVTLLAATDGNHGRAVAHMAAMMGIPALVLVPSTVTETARRGIEGEGAEVRVLGLPYDDVVTAAAEAAGDDATLLHIQDTAWPGYHDVPQWIVDGYQTLCTEASEQLDAAGAGRPDVVAVPMGVGSLAQAVVRHFRSQPRTDGDQRQPTVLSVEPDTAPAVLVSLEAGERTSVPTGSTMMLGLNCGTPSEIAWPILRSGIDAALTVTEDEAARAVHDLQRLGVDAGPCGAASLAGVRALREAVGLDPDAVVLLLSTEGLEANPLPDRYR